MPIKVYDKFGVLQSWEWLVANFGNMVIHNASPGWGWRITEIRESDDLIVSQMEKGNLDHHGFSKPSDFGIITEAMVAAGLAEHEIAAPAVVMVKHLGESGNPVVGRRSCFYWNEADPEPECVPENGVAEGMISGLSVSGYTNDNGDIGHAMGKGAYYDPTTQIGPHAIFVCGENTDVVFGIGMIMGTNHRTLWFVCQWSYVEEGDLETTVRNLLPQIESSMKYANRALNAAWKARDEMQAVYDALEAALPEITK